ncbi:hypothetical protein CW304_01620 [Bacillus sp. UFRGS-B20]|nr:hypothetical protein CW304_01620 [Bacillus sp. UFRGS-B20]
MFFDSIVYFTNTSTSPVLFFHHNHPSHTYQVTCKNTIFPPSNMPSPSPILSFPHHGLPILFISSNIFPSVHSFFLPYKHALFDAYYP